MLTKTRGIVLHVVRYGDNSLISTIYTQDFGRQSFLVNAAHGPRSKNKAALLQPLFLLEMEVYYKQNREVQRIKEFRSAAPYHSIPFNIIKSTQAIFLAEVLFKILQEEESFPQLFDFLENSLLYYDSMEEGISNFHLWLLARLTEFLGILPNTEEMFPGSWFDLVKGKVVLREPAHPRRLTPEITALFVPLLTLKISDLPELAITRKQRENLTEGLLDYLHQHFESLANVRSLHVLKELFR